ncbi:cytoplasmic dynein 1 heavy chain 1-like isoform X2 [Gopherus flavomarginatus]|uniref:cytoplasmic dynein 1 heavy chain 1-like isoform X2 n=1 Tax=Gopherus flavomarginatus TaxID=286002 RepID=UPI0021CC2FA8|nr:cytoplasmic dynein 1 heavy chain 1-like isoform X2 [Gopherus flavomarginatus]
MPSICGHTSPNPICLPIWVNKLDMEIERILGVRLQAGLRAWTQVLEQADDKTEVDMDTDVPQVSHKPGGEPKIKALLEDATVEVAEKARMALSMPEECASAEGVCWKLPCGAARSLPKITTTSSREEGGDWMTGRSPAMSSHVGEDGLRVGTGFSPVAAAGASCTKSSAMGANFSLSHELDAQG